MKKIIIALSLLLMLCACSSKSDLMHENSYDYGMGITDNTADYETSSELEKDRKLIKEYHISSETKKYDETKAKITEAIKKYNGYVQNSDEYAYNENSRSISYVIRIPTNETTAFLNEICDELNVLSKSEEVEDVTSAYQDVEARLKSYKEEREQLLNLLEKANNLSEIIEIRKYITENQYNIENYEARLRNYDLLTTYSTIDLSIDEVEKIIIKKDNVFTRISERFGNSITNLTNMFVSLFVFLIGDSLYIILLVAIGYIISKLFKKYLKKQ